MLLIPFLACAPVDPSEQVDRSTATTTWSGERSLDESMTVAAGETLEIEPGTVVTAAKEVTLTIEGTLVARGTADAPITFTGEAEQRWYGIVFAESAVDATFEEIDEYVSGSIVEYAVLEHAQRALTLDGSSPYVRANLFQNNVSPGTVDPIGGAALLVQNGSTARIRDNTFTGNVASPFGQGGAVNVRASDPILQGNLFSANDAPYGGGLSTDVMASPIVGNHFEGNTTLTEGGGMSLISSVSAVLDNTVVGNHAEKDGGGIHVCVTCFPHSVPFLFDNRVIENESDASTPDEGAAGVGAAYLKAMADNDIYGNTRDGLPSDFGWFHPVSEGYPAWASAPSIAGNYWGDVDVDATIFDGSDDAEFGIVDWEPARDAEVGTALPRATLTTRKLRYGDVGDEMPVFLTLYNPGPEAEFRLVMVRGEGDSAAPFLPALDLPGATPEGDGFHVSMPQDSVWFGEVASLTYEGSTEDGGYFEAHLLDRDGEEVSPSVRASFSYGVTE